MSHLVTNKPKGDAGTGISTQSLAWQHPFVNIFKLCEVERWKDVERSGNVRSQMDRTIGKTVVQIAGAIPAVNYIKLPKGRAGLNLSGRFLYMQVKLDPAMLFSTHVEVLSTDGNLVRISMGNIFRHDGSSKKKATAVQLSVQPTDKWTVIAVDMREALAAQQHSYATLRSLQFCANQLVRGVFTSDLKFSLQAMPRDLVISQALDASEFEMLWLPAEPMDLQEPHIVKPSKLLVGEWSSKSNNSTNTAKPSTSPKPRKSSSRPATPATDTSEPDQDVSTAGQTLQPEPLLQLKQVNGYSGHMPKLLQWVPQQQELLLAAGALLTVMSPEGQQQRFLMGHTAPVCAMAFSGDGALLATGQEGKGATIRLWDYASGQCLAVLSGHAGGLAALDVSPDGRALLAVGLDQHARQLLVLWDISAAVAGTGGAFVVLRHITDYNVKCVKFSAFEADQFMTCGRDSIRVYRLKGGTLRGMSVQLPQQPERVPSVRGSITAALGPNIFTDIAFEVGQSLYQLPGQRHVYVASASGAVFDINYSSRTLAAVHQLHAGAINSMSLHEGFCVTASDDKMLRIWPLDFGDFLMEAEHEAPVTATGISPEGLRVAVGTENGVIGMLDISTHAYSTLLRSHCGAIRAVAAHPSMQEYCTVSEDGTIRVWSASSHQQVYEFDAVGEGVTCAAYHPSGCDLACGFDSGIVRVFDITSAALVQELKQHKGPVAQVHYSGDGTRLVSRGEDNSLCVYEAIQGYLPVKMLTPMLDSCKTCMALSPDGQYLATVAPDPSSRPSSLLIFQGTELSPYMRLDTDLPGFTALAFSPDGRELLALSSDQRLERFDMASGHVIQQVEQVHTLGCSTLVVDPASRFLLTGGHDKLLKAWPLLPRAQAQLAQLPPAAQTFLGHPDAIQGVALLSDTAVSVCEGGCVLVWDVVCTMQSADGDTAHRGQQQSQQQPAMGSGSGPKSWLPVGADGVVQQAGNLGRDPGVPAPDANRLDQWNVGLARPGSSSPQPVVPPQVSSSKMVGVNGGALHSVVWLAERGEVAYPLANLLVLESLQDHSQSFLEHHTQQVSCVAATSDRTILASASAAPEASGYAEICLWTSATHKKQHVLLQHKARVQHMAFSPDAVWLVSISSSPEALVVLWDVASGRAVAIGHTAGGCQGLAWLKPLAGAADVEFVTVGEDGLCLWTLQPTFLEQRQLLLSAATCTHCTAVACMPNGRSLAVADALGTVYEVAIREGHLAFDCPVASLPGHQITHIQLAADAPTACIATASGELLMLAISRASDAAESDFGAQVAAAAVQSVAAAAGSTEPAAAPDSSLPGSWQQQSRLQLDAAVTTLCLEGSQLVEGLVGTAANTVWYVHSGSGSKHPLLCGHPSDVLSLAAAPHDACMLASTAADGVLRIWTLSEDAQDASPAAELQSEVACTSVQFTPAGTHCIAGYADGSLRLYDMRHNSIMWSVGRHPAPVAAVACHPDQPLILSASRDGGLAVTQATSAQLQHHCLQLVGSPTPLHCLALHPLATTAAATWLDRFVVCSTPWHSPSTSILASYRCPAVPAETPEGVQALVAFLPHTMHLLLFTSPCLLGTVLVFDYVSGAVARSISLPQTICSLQPAADGSIVALGGCGGAVYIVDSQEPRFTQLSGHMLPVQAVQFVVGSQRLMAAAGSVLSIHNRDAFSR